MSIIGGRCGLCGVSVEVSETSNALASGTTGRMWCGNCNYNMRTKIFQWIFNSEVTIETETKMTTHKTPPIRRPDWDTYYLDIAKAVSARGDCVRAQHGAVIVKNHKIVSTGYNGSPPGSPLSCGATGNCPRNHDPNAKHSEGQYDNCWAIHAEANAVMRASWEDMQGAIIYITGKPCPGCSKLIASSGIARTVTP